MCLSVISKLWYNIFHDHYSPTTLSDDIIFFHILNQLPSKSLLRFSCVSKLWYNTIHHDTFFIDSHFNHSKSKPSHVLISGTLSETHFSFNYLEDQEQQQHQGPSFSYTLVTNFKNDRRQVIGSVNGLTCFSTMCFIEVCNPSTHEILVIPYPPTTNVYDICCYGFGFDPLMNQYKVLLVTRPYIHSIYHIFTLGPRAQDCLWRDITVTSHLSPRMEFELSLCGDPLIFSNGAFFTVIPRINTIIMFDIHYEKFQVIPGPQVSRDDGLLHTICELRGCPYAVYLAYLRGGYEFSFYALKKEEQSSSSNSNVGSNIHFVFEQAVRLPMIIRNFVIPSFTEFSGQMLMQWFDRQFYAYNPLTKKLQKGVLGLSLGSYGYSALFVTHIDNLLSLKKLVPMSPPGAPATTDVKYLSSREATMYDERSSNTLSPVSILCCFGLNAKKHQQDMNRCDHISRFKSRQL